MRISVVVGSVKVTRTDVDSWRCDLILDASVKRALCSEKHGRECSAAVDGGKLRVMIAKNVGDIAACHIRIVPVIDFHGEGRAVGATKLVRSVCLIREAPLACRELVEILSSKCNCGLDEARSCSFGRRRRRRRYED